MSVRRVAEERSASSESLDFLADRGVAGSRIHAAEGATSLLGSPLSWPQSLQTAVRIALDAPHPSFVGWGHELSTLYNDACVALLGARHPEALGRPAREVWHAIWSELAPQAEQVLQEGRTGRTAALALTVVRDGSSQEAFFTVCLSPLPREDGTVGGLFGTLHDETRRTLAERRLHVLQDLAAHGAAAPSAPEAARRLMERLERHCRDIPFACVYLVENARHATLAGTTMSASAAVLPAWTALTTVDALWPIANVIHLGEAAVVDHIERRLGRIPSGPWPEPVQQAMLLPLRAAGHEGVLGVLAAGIGRRCALDAEYREFLDSVAAQVAATVAASDGARTVCIRCAHPAPQPDVPEVNGICGAPPAGASAREGSSMADQQRALSFVEQLPLPVALFTLGPDYRVVMANRVLRELQGRDIRGLTLRESSSDPERARRFLEQAVRSGELVAVHDIESPAPRDGDPTVRRYWNAWYQPWRDEAGVISGVLLTSIEVTDIVRARHERERLLAAEQDARRAAERVNRAKDEFLAMLSHELRNPLAPIRTAAQILKLSAGTEPRLRQTSEMIGRQVEHLARLVDDLLDVSRVTRGLIELQREPLELKDVVAAAVEQSRPLIDARRHRLELRLPAESARTRGDRVRLVQVLANLLNNAAKYTEEGGEIALELRVEPEWLEVAVRDSGIGIDPELLPRVFELFTQAARSPDRAQGGLGLGLALVKSLVEMHGGAVQARSAGAGAGAEFIVRLPRLAVPAEAAAKSVDPSGAAASASGALRVLVVDDNVDAAASLAMLLEMEGHSVATAHDARSALARAVAERPRVLLLDIGLPDMDGYELARALRARPELEGAVLVALTGYGQAEDRRRSSLAGFDHHLVKPADPQALTALLAQAAEGPARAASP